jgi:nicotinamidase-related amidase
LKKSGHAYSKWSCVKTPSNEEFSRVPDTLGSRRPNSWAQSSFANTDLDFQLKQHCIRKIILVGMVANTCIESTGRFGMELGYHVTLAM